MNTILREKQGDDGDDTEVADDEICGDHGEVEAAEDEVAYEPAPKRQRTECEFCATEQKSIAYCSKTGSLGVS